MREGGLPWGKFVETIHQKKAPRNFSGAMGNVYGLSLIHILHILEDQGIPWAVSTTNELVRYSPREDFAEIAGDYYVPTEYDSNLRIDDLNCIYKAYIPCSIKDEDMVFATGALDEVPQMCIRDRSNAILVSKDHAGIGMGPGQPNRVDSAKLACERAHEACERMGVPAEGLVCASDAFFPFRDNVDTLAGYGVKAIIQPLSLIHIFQERTRCG